MINLTIFNNNLFEAGTEFFNQLGIRLNSNTAASLGARELLKDQYKDKDIFRAITETYFVGLVDDSLFDSNVSLLSKDKISLKEAAGKINAEYNGLMVFAVKLPDSYSPKRSDIADLTRAFNRVSKNIPVVLLLKYGNLVSFATSERTKYKQEWREGEKIGKISLLKDISIESPHTGHLKILDDLKIEPKVTDFNALYKQWQEVFDVQLLNKKFYQELANWYFWAVKTVGFPDDVEKDEGVRNATNVIRLITRLIFVWFVKEKGLVHDKLFDRDSLKDILNYSDKTGSTYYKAILQNLFFATLNTEMNKDIPGSRRFVNRQYGIHYFYRYERFFTDKKKALALFENIPFLNGGLFECLDKNVGQDDEIRIDCFSNSSQKADRLVVPDDLFFSPEQAIDLNAIYGTKGKSYKVRGIINILNSYKFTIAENTPVEEEIALDPELLGKVFENLLASYNPETQTTARKKTGSFYTPREIVNYMVDESLIEYLSSKLTGHNSSSPPLGKGSKGELKESYESRLRRLLAYSEEPHQFTLQEVDVLINAIDNAKILDPACGSGAFPMGILHKMTHILHKLDPDNEKWKQRQIDKVEELIRSAEKIGDSTSREQIVKDLEATKQNIEDAFEHNELDYGRKLYLIENCIYGIDIQPIAVQIAKLRFFISLIVDQGIDAERKNLGIRPLPNLETKFVAANTLIGIEKPRFETLGLRNLEIDVKEKELKQVREKHFSARTPKTKDKYRLEDARLRAELAGLFKNDGFSAETTHKLAHWDPYDQNASADFFDPEWMFGIKDGFDVVLGNPPYVRADAGEEQLLLRQQIIKSKRYNTLWEKWDLFIPFIELGYKLLRESGITTMIVSDAYCHSKYAQKSQNWFLQNSRILRLDFLSKIKVFEAGVHNIVYLYQKSDGVRNKPERRVHKETFGTVTYLSTNEQRNLNYRVFFPEDDYVCGSSIPTVRLADICYVFVGMVVNAHEKLAPGAFDMDDLVVNRKDSMHPKAFVEGKHLDRWLPATNKFLEWGTKRAPSLFRRPTFPQLYEVTEKILVQRSPGPDPKACYDNQHLHFTESSVGFILWHSLAKVRNNSLKKAARYKDEKPLRPDLPKREALEKTSCRFAVKYLLAVLNSSVAREFLRAHRRSNIHLYPDDWKQLPIPDVPQDKQAPIVALVDRILIAKEKTPCADISAFEKRMDEMVYALYGLTPKEIEIVEGKG